MVMNGCIWLKQVWQSIIPPVLGCLEFSKAQKWPKMAENYPKLAQNLYCQAIEYSCGIKKFPMVVNGCM